MAKSESRVTNLSLSPELQAEVNEYLQICHATGLAQNFLSGLESARIFMGFIAKTDEARLNHYRSDAVQAEIPTSYTGWLRQRHAAFQQERPRSDGATVAESYFTVSGQNKHHRLDKLTAALHAAMKEPDPPADQRGAKLRRIDRLSYLMHRMIHCPKDVAAVRRAFGIPAKQKAASEPSSEPKRRARRASVRSAKIAHM